MTALDTRTLMERARDGDAEAFGEVYRRTRREVRAYKLRRVRDAHLADDLTAEAYARAWRGISRYRWMGRDPLAWLLTIARNLTADHYRSSRYRIEISVDGFDCAAGEPASRDDPERDALARLDAAAIRAQIGPACRDLTEDQRRCLVLRLVDEVPVSDVARQMRRSSGAVVALHHRAVTGLRLRLTESALTAGQATSDVT